MFDFYSSATSSRSVQKLILDGIGEIKAYLAVRIMDMGFCTTDLSLAVGIAVNTDKVISFLTVGNRNSVFQANKFVCFSGINNIDFSFEVFFYIGAQLF